MRKRPISALGRDCAFCKQRPPRLGNLGYGTTSQGRRDEEHLGYGTTDVGNLGHGTGKPATVLSAFAQGRRDEQHLGARTAIGNLGYGTGDWQVCLSITRLIESGNLISQSVMLAAYSYRPSHL